MKVPTEGKDDDTKDMIDERLGEIYVRPLP